jgi:hypothetical protein
MDVRGRVPSGRTSERVMLLRRLRTRTAPRGVETLETEEATMRVRLSLLIAAALVFTACVGSDPSGGGGAPDDLELRLVSFSSCDEFLSYVQEHGVEQVTAWGLPGQSWWWGPMLRAGSTGAVAEDAAVGSGEAVPAPTAGVDYSTTNLQTVGVDEPDIVKTDGELMVALAQGKLFVLDVTGSTPVLLGSLALDDVWVRDLVLVGDRALLLGESGGGVMPISSDVRTVPGSSGPISALVEVDLSDPAAPRVERKLLVDGSYLSARMIDGVARRRGSYPTGLPRGAAGARPVRRDATRSAEPGHHPQLHDRELGPVLRAEDGSGARSPRAAADCAS